MFNHIFININKKNNKRSTSRTRIYSSIRGFENTHITQAQTLIPQQTSCYTMTIQMYVVCENRTRDRQRIFFFFFERIFKYLCIFVKAIVVAISVCYFTSIESESSEPSQSVRVIPIPITSNLQPYPNANGIDEIRSKCQKRR